MVVVVVVVVVELRLWFCLWPTRLFGGLLTRLVVVEGFSVVEVLVGLGVVLVVGVVVVEVVVVVVGLVVDLVVVLDGVAGAGLVVLASSLVESAVSFVDGLFRSIS